MVLMCGPIISILQLNAWKLRGLTKEREQGTDYNIYIKNEGIELVCNINYHIKLWSIISLALVWPFFNS